MSVVVESVQLPGLFEAMANYCLNFYDALKGTEVALAKQNPLVDASGEILDERLSIFFDLWFQPVYGYDSDWLETGKINQTNRGFFKYFDAWPQYHRISKEFVKQWPPPALGMGPYNGPETNPIILVHSLKQYPQRRRRVFGRSLRV